MNNKIIELAVQSGLNLELQSLRVELFAELLIRECLSDLKDRIAIRYQGSDKDCDIGYGMEIVYWEIVDKFGVEA